MEIYLVGGAVRDKYLGLTPKERDWVVVGSSVEEMVNNGYKPVGKDFPVFLHPKTHEEYALARTERKTAKGYQGFTFHTAPDVSLEDDLIRRDLTINALAEDENGKLVDLFQGKADLDNRILRHISEAFTEDPVRLLRVARFASQLGAFNFTVAKETQVLLKTLVSNGEVDALVPERVWQELEKTLTSQYPERFFIVLKTTAALNRLFPELLADLENCTENNWDTSQLSKALQALHQCSQRETSTACRFASLIANSQQAATCLNTLDKRYPIPKHYKELANLLTTQQAALSRQDHDAATIVAVLEACDAFRREERFVELLACINTQEQKALKAYWLDALNTCRQINNEEISKQHQGAAIKEAITKARIAALAR